MQAGHCAPPCSAEARGLSASPRSCPPAELEKYICRLVSARPEPHRMRNILEERAQQGIRGRARLTWSSGMALAQPYVYKDRLCGRRPSRLR